MSATWALPFDPTGKQESNLIRNESHTVVPPLLTDFYVIMPRFAPFFRNGLKLKEASTNRYWELGKDYALSHMHHSATYGIGTGVYGTITILNRSFTGTLIFDEYQSLGGPWTLDENGLVAFLENVTIEPRRTTWEMVMKLQEQFPPIPHNFDVGYIGDINLVIDGIAGIKEAILSKAIDAEAIARFVTKNTIGLSEVLNYGVATIEEALALVGNKYLVPSVASALVKNEVSKITGENVDNIVTIINNITTDVMAY